MRPHRTLPQPLAPRKGVMHALARRLGAVRPQAHASDRLQAHPHQAVPDLRDLDQRVREIGEW